MERCWPGAGQGDRAMPCRAVPCITRRCCAIRHITVPHRAAPCRAVPCSAPPGGPSLPSSGAAARFQPPGTTRLLPCPPRCPRSSSRSDQRSEGPRGAGAGRADPAAGPGATTGARGGPAGALSSGPWRLLARPRPGTERKAPERTGDEKQEEVSGSQRQGTGVLPAHPKTLGIIH